MLIHQDWALEVGSADLINPHSPLFMGIECEIEGITSHGSAESSNFNITTDGSLRNNGYEYVSKPLLEEQVVDSFKKLHATIRCRSELKFSQRTSIHVHANCMNLEASKVRDIILWYALYEELFFLMCNPDRRHNIHCVPLTETFLPTLYHMNLGNLVARWHKYTALNIKPLSKYGTIEFRHMQGHDDAHLLDEWLHVISRLFNWAKVKQLTRASLTPETFKDGYLYIFGHSHIGNNWDMAQTLISNSIIDVKLGVM